MDEGVAAGGTTVQLSASLVDADDDDDDAIARTEKEERREDPSADRIEER